MYIDMLITVLETCEWTLCVKAGLMKLGTNYSNYDNIMWYIALYCYDISYDVSWALFFGDKS